jgi:hypothetical protein
VAKRGKYDEPWVFRDVRLMLLGLLLLFLGAVHEVFLWLLLALIAAIGVVAAVRAVQRRRRWRSRPPGEFWADKL